MAPAASNWIKMHFANMCQIWWQVALPGVQVLLPLLFLLFTSCGMSRFRPVMYEEYCFENSTIDG